MTPYTSFDYISKRELSAFDFKFWAESWSCYIFHVVAVMLRVYFSISYYVTKLTMPRQIIRLWMNHNGLVLMNELSVFILVIDHN